MPPPAAAPDGLPKQAATPTLDKYGIDLTALARQKKFSPLIGRRYELMEMVRILERTEKNNPLLIGEAGVGKTMIVKGLAQRMASGNINSALLRGKRLIEIHLNSVLAGTTFRGEFERAPGRHYPGSAESPRTSRFFSTKSTPSWAPGRPEGASMPPPSSSPTWQAASCAASVPRRSPNTANISNPMPRSTGGSSPSSSRSPRPRRRAKSSRL